MRHPSHKHCSGSLERPGDVRHSGRIGLLVLQGLLIRRVGIDGRFGAEILGEGDLLRPWQGQEVSPALARTTGWRVLQRTRVASRPASRAASRAISRADWGSCRSRARALTEPRCEHGDRPPAARHVRLHMLFWQLADRWGRVRSDGISVPLHLTHSVLAELVAARRPTVTSALSELATGDCYAPSMGRGCSRETRRRAGRVAGGRRAARTWGRRRVTPPGQRLGGRRHNSDRLSWWCRFRGEMLGAKVNARGEAGVYDGRRPRPNAGAWTCSRVGCSLPRKIRAVRNAGCPCLARRPSAPAGVRARSSRVCAWWPIPSHVQ